MEWLDDTDVVMTPFRQVPSAGRVATGFDRIYSTLRTVPIPDEGIAAESLEPPGGTFAEEIAQLVVKRSSQPQGVALAKSSVIVTGHSLGAALCTLYALENAIRKFLANPLVCTFASPRVGDSAFAAAFNGLNVTSWRVVNKPDIVPNLPPDVFGFVHVNQQSLLDSTGKVGSTLACAHALLTYLFLLDPSIKPPADCQATPGDTVRGATIFAAEGPANPAVVSSIQPNDGRTMTITINICALSEKNQ